MSNDITGKEIIHPEITTDLEASGLQNTYSYGGETLRQRALREFMCALVQREGITIPDDIEWISNYANDLTTAYIAQLNKTT